MLSKPIKRLSMSFCPLQKWRLSFSPLVSSYFWPVLACSRLHCFFQVVPYFTSEGKFSVNQVVRFYYKVRQALLQCEAICITKWGNNYKLEQNSAQYKVEHSNSCQQRIQMNLLKLIIVTTSCTTSFTYYKLHAVQWSSIDTFTNILMLQNLEYYTAKINAFKRYFVNYEDTTSKIMISKSHGMFKLSVNSHNQLPWHSVFIINYIQFILVFVFCY